MMDRETIIRGLEIERECVSRDCDRECCKCDLVQGGDYLLSVYDGAIALLKEQEPHVLTLDEAVDGSHVYYVEFQYHMDRGWVKCDFDRMYVNGEVAMLFLRDKTFYQQKEDYGTLWRLWSAHPTYDQRLEAKWE